MTTPKPRPGLARGPVRVKARQTLTPRMLRLTLDTRQLPDDLAFAYPAHAIKLFVPAAQGTAARTYTVRRYDAQRHEMDVDFLLHGHGPAAAWAERVAVGETIELAGPRAGFERDPQAAWQLMIGDATAIPAIASMLESLPAHDRALAFIAVRDAGEEQAIAAPPHAQVHWVHGDIESPEATAQALRRALQDTPLPGGPAQVFIAAESSAVRTLRGLFPRAGQSDHTYAVTRLHATGYWKRGAQDYHDHH